MAQWRTEEPLDESERGEWKAGLKLNIQKTKIMASGPTISWQIAGETMETVTYFFFWGSKTTADGDCSHEIKKRLLLGRKAITNLDSILESRDITLPTKVCLLKSMVFPVVMYVATGLEKVSFHSNPKERQCQRMFKLPHNCTHLTR